MYAGLITVLMTHAVAQSRRSQDRFPMVSLEYFIDVILPGCTVTVGSTQPLTKWVPGIFPKGKGGRCVRLTPLPPSCAECLEIWKPQTPGTLLDCNRHEQGLLYLYSHWPDVSTKRTLHFFIIKPTRYSNFTNLPRHETLHVSCSSSSHHQEFIHCTLSNGICHTGL